ncbi:MAG: hypothetical protein JO073_07560, partial [Actinobacteria bacterium]|nr:hypothetical protein [Actinomycetota bacterium]
MRQLRKRRTVAVAALVVVVAAVVASASGAATQRAAGKPTITIATNSWEGSLANNVVAQYV